MWVRKKKGKFKTLFLKKKKRWRPRKKTWYLKILVAFFIIFITIPIFIWYLWFDKNILQKLPDINKIENVIFSQTTTITDRNWKVLYKIFDENRKYVWLDKISKNVQNALVSIEDKNFWENPWIDLRWIVRAWVHDILYWKIQGASTITQQLIKNLLLTNERTIKRKLKELVLAFKLNFYLNNKVNKQYKWLSEENSKKKVKEKILEMYLNYVFFGNNSYGVQAASQTYFKKDASNLTVLESSILASIPKSPLNYNPILNRKNNLWELKFIWISGEKLNLTWDVLKGAKTSYIDYLKNKSFIMLNNESDIIKTLMPKNLSYKDIKIKYTIWRKDNVLARMYLDKYIDKTEFIQAIKESFDKKIHAHKIDIKAPHFVFNVMNKLKKNYWKEIIEKSWWTIKTSLDYNIQKIAEDTVMSWSWYLAKKWANNSSLLYVNSLNWDIIAYVGSKKYWDENIDWQVDMITSKRQCWSVIKPLIYTNAFIENQTLTPDSPIYDTEFPIADAGNSLNNFDWKFLWLMPIKKALPYSRNIPATKMYYIGWWEKNVKDFLHSIGLNTIPNADKVYHGYPLAIWAVDVRIIDMAKAYSHLSNENPVEINPILEIKWPNWNLIYRKKNKKVKKVIPNSVLSFMWYILSNPSYRPSWWNNVMQVLWLKIATKSWTTNIIDPKTWIKYPRDGWFIWYTPSKVFVTWAWNTKWEHMWENAYGWWTAWKVWNDFIKRLKDKKLIQNEEMALKWTSYINVNSINWKKASNKTPIQISKKTIARIDWIPKSDQWKTIKKLEIDTMCNWLVSEYTPEKDKENAYIIKAPLSYRPNDWRWQEPVNNWWKNYWVKKYQKIFNSIVLLKEPTEICSDRLIIAEKWELDFSLNYPKNNQTLSYVFDLWLNIKNTPFNLKTINIYIDNKLVQEESYNGEEIIDVYLPNSIWVGNHNLKVVIVDEQWYKKFQNINIKLVSNDKTDPFLDRVYKKWDKYFYVFKDNHSRVLWWKIICDWVEKRFKWPIWIGSKKDCDYDVIDYYGNGY